MQEQLNHGYKKLRRRFRYLLVDTFKQAPRKAWEYWGRKGMELKLL